MNETKQYNIELHDLSGLKITGWIPRSEIVKMVLSNDLQPIYHELNELGDDVKVIGNIHE